MMSSYLGLAPLFVIRLAWSLSSGKRRPAFFCGIPAPPNSRKMRLDPHYTEQEYAQLFQEGEEIALNFFFRELHPALALFANRWVNNRSLAEEIAADAFIKTWKMHRKLDSYPSIRAYLYKVV